MTNDELCVVMDVVLRDIEMNVGFTLEDMQEMDLHGHTAESWLRRWEEMGLARFWCTLDTRNRNRLVAYLIKKGMFRELQ